MTTACENGRRRLRAIAAVMILIMAFVGTSAIVEDDDNEADGEIILATLTVLALLSAVESGWIIGNFILDHTSESGTDESVIRGYEAKAVAESIVNNLSLYDNAMANYGQIWRLTSEHHIRQAELAASEIYTNDGGFDASSILSMSGVYTNSAHMLDNAASQVNEMYRLVSDTLRTWNGTDVYKGKMQLELNWGSGSMSTKESFGFFLGSTCVDVKEGHDRVFLTPQSTLWVDSDTYIEQDGGTRIPLLHGFNELSEMPEFSEGVYVLGPGVSYCGDILPVIDEAASPLYSGAVMSCGDRTELAYISGGKIIVGQGQNDRIALTIHPEGAESKTVDLTEMFADFSDLIDTIYGTMAEASSAAATVWGIFERAGSASQYLTTLMVPNNYDGIEITQAQQTIITILAMEQLATYWQENNGEIKQHDYMLSDSLSLFVRGDIVSNTGETIYRNAIYTPFFYQDTTLANGTNQVQRQAILAVWTLDGENLSSWDGLTSDSSAMLVTVHKGYTLSIAEMKNQGKIVNSVDLTVDKISIIDPNELVHDPIEPKPKNDLDRIVMLVLVILGLLALISGWRSGNYIVLAAGVVMLIMGLMFSGAIAGLLHEWFGWRIELG